MGSLVNLMSVIGVEKTLVIACGDYGLEKTIELNDSVFVHFLPDNMLQRHDYAEKGKIQNYIETKNCTQIVFVGTLGPTLVKSLLRGSSLRLLREAIKFDLQPILMHKSKAILAPPVQDQMLVELHVISQCNTLLDYYFIRERVENRQLDIRGIVAGAEEQMLKTIYYNGFVYNDLLSMN